MDSSLCIFIVFITMDRREPPFSHLAVADPGFPDVATHPRGGGVNLLFGKTFAENCVKLKEIGPLGGSANASVQKNGICHLLVMLLVRYLVLHA